MVTGFAARPALWFGILALPAIFLGGVSFLWMLLPQISGVVLPATAFLFFALAGHLLAMGIVGEMILYTGDYRPVQMLKGSFLKFDDPLSESNID